LLKINSPVKKKLKISKQRGVNMSASINGIWVENKLKVSTPKMKVEVDKDNRITLDLVNMTKAEQDDIINSIVKVIYNDNYRVKQILGGVRVYAPRSI
jgi:hypothetical protein